MGNAVSGQGFRHRRNGDGTWDSIYLRCYLTAARKLTEQELLAVEVGHECDESSWILKNTAAAESRGSVSQVPASPALLLAGLNAPAETPRHSQTKRPAVDWPVCKRPSNRPAGLRIPA